MTETRRPPTADRPSRQVLVERTLDHLLTDGRVDESLRTTAAAIGVTHSLLIYHFGSHSELLNAVGEACEQRNREHLAALRVRSKDPVRVVRAMWRHTSRPAVLPLYRLSFALQARAEPPERDAQRTAWLEVLEPLFVGMGFTSRRARDEALMLVAACDGLLWQLLTGADPRAVNRAAEALLARYPGMSPEDADHGTASAR